MSQGVNWSLMAVFQLRLEQTNNTVNEGEWVAPGVHNRYYTYYHTATIMVTCYKQGHIYTAVAIYMTILSLHAIICIYIFYFFYFFNMPP